MPELPEVETVRRTLAPLVVGRMIVGARFGVFAGVVGTLTPDEFTARITGQRIEAVGRRAKYLFLALENGAFLMVHLRMTGQLVVADRHDSVLRFEHLAIELTEGRDLRFADQRKFGRVLLATAAEVAALNHRLGPEPLAPAFSAGALGQLLTRRPGRLKSVLLDQRVVAGLGNIYVDEALFRARLHPERAANGLTPHEVRRLHHALQTSLRQGIANRGTTFSSFHDAAGDAGGNQHHLLVYGRGRAGLPCVRCHRPLVRSVVGGRGTSSCPRCQRIEGEPSPPG